MRRARWRGHTCVFTNLWLRNKTSPTASSQPPTNKRPLSCVDVWSGRLVEPYPLLSREELPRKSTGWSPHYCLLAVLPALSTFPPFCTGPCCKHPFSCPSPLPLPGNTTQAQGILNLVRFETDTDFLEKIKLGGWVCPERKGRLRDMVVRLFCVGIDIGAQESV